jgi:hypothetical protein
MTLVEWAGRRRPARGRAVAAHRWRRERASALGGDGARARCAASFRTSILGALMFSATLFENNGYRGIRRVIDVSGDGTNNQGPIVTQVRDDVLAKGIVINGLPIMLKEPQAELGSISRISTSTTRTA